MRLRNVSQILLVGAAALFASLGFGQTVVPVGSGSYASTVPSDRLNDDGYYAPTPGTMLSQYSTLNFASYLAGKPMPTNHWWTDLLIGERQSGSTWFQKQFDGNGNAGQLWCYPQMIVPSNHGLTFYLPNSWAANGSPDPSFAVGGMDWGPALWVDHYTGIRLAATDSMIGDFGGSAYPSGWTPTGDLVGTTPIQGGTFVGENPPVSGLEENACLNSWLGADSHMGTLTSPAFTINNSYIDLKVGGGTDTANTCVQLVIGGTVVKTAAGQGDATLRWNQWNVAAYKGQSAQIVIRDTSAGSWGFILCNIIIGTNSSASPDAMYPDMSVAASAKVSAFSDWSLDYVETDSRGASTAVTCAKGNPFVWVRYTGVSPRIHLGGGTLLTDANGNQITPGSDGSFTATCFAFTIPGGGTHTMGVYGPDNTHWMRQGDYVTTTKPAYLVYGDLPDINQLGPWQTYAYARVTATSMTWVYNSAGKNSVGLGGSVDTTWAVSTSPLKGSGTSTLQGFLPHHLNTTLTSGMSFINSFATPRGLLKVTPGSLFRISWPFKGILPMLPDPHTNGLANDYQPGREQTYLSNFAANHPSAGADTYFQGKELGLSAQYMSQAAQYGDAATFFSLESSLKAQLADWYTYSPGKAKNYFAYYPGWGSLVGFQDSFGSTGFNDHHFHYGYFATATALVGMHDQGFLNQYGSMAALLCKDYNNWDRNDTRFPYMRTFDVFEGHSNAGGVGSPAGENQESARRLCRGG